MVRLLRSLIWILCAILWLGGALLVAPPTGRAIVLSDFSVCVKDEEGVPRSDAWVVIRYRFGEHQWERFTAGKTGADGCVIFQLDPEEDYVVLVYYNEFGLEEHWSYGYIGKQDWSRSKKVFQRNRPWIDEVSMGAQPWSVGVPRDVALTIAHGLRDMDYDFQVKVALIVDDDGEQPYLSETMSETQVFYTGIEPFHFSYAPTSEGRFLVRFIIYTRFEANEWEISDDGGWQWWIEAVRVVDEPAQIRGRVYLDLNHDGAYMAPEPLVANVRVLLTQGDVVVAESVTSTDGQYEFQAPAGSYQMKIGQAPRGYRVPGARDIVCTAGQVLENLDWALEVWYCRVPLFLTEYRP
jgi:hypothetical protein